VQLNQLILQPPTRRNTMLGIRFIKTQPTTHLMQFRRGQLRRQGPGLSLVYYAPTTTLVAVPVGSQDCDFMLELATGDFQAVTVQGQVTYRVKDPQCTAALMDFSLAADGKRYASDDPQRLRERVTMQLKVIIQQAIQSFALAQALKASAQVARVAHERLSAQVEIQALGLEVLGVALSAIKPTPDIARALEARAREAQLQAADDAVYQRRMSAVEKERSIRQNELDTEIAVETKKCQIRETQMDAKAIVLRRENELAAEQMTADVAREAKRKDLVANQAENTRALAEAEAHRVKAVMSALQAADPRVVQALAAVGMQPSQLIAQAFGGIAEKAERIGQLNVSPELLNTLAAAGTHMAAPVGTRKATS
jgi:regulator of protease activity HflC (stomatin/prohibitin superfamily)